MRPWGHFRKRNRAEDVSVDPRRRCSAGFVLPGQKRDRCRAAARTRTCTCRGLRGSASAQTGAALVAAKAGGGLPRAASPVSRQPAAAPPEILPDPIVFPAWCLGHDPSAQILCVSHAEDLADKLSRDCRRILASDWYQRLFPTRLSPRHQAVPEFETTAQGSRVATSVGGVLTGLELWISVRIPAGRAGRLRGHGR